MTYDWDDTTQTLTVSGTGKVVGNYDTSYPLSAYKNKARQNYFTGMELQRLVHRRCCLSRAESCFRESANSHWSASDWKFWRRVRFDLVIADKMELIWRKKMETRVAVIAIIIEDGSSAQEVNELYTVQPNILSDAWESLIVTKGSVLSALQSMRRRISSVRCPAKSAGWKVYPSKRRIPMLFQKRIRTAVYTKVLNSKWKRRR